ncbi:MAG: hypothetical protein ACHQFW_05380 [Chitinophagales bacterium]
MQQKLNPWPIRFILILIGISGILLSKLYVHYSGNGYAIYIIVLIAQLLILDMMMKESDIYMTIYLRLIYICIAIYIVGACFKILHISGSDPLLLVSLSLIGLIYIVRTFNKRNIKLLDISKCLWVVFAISTPLFNLFHWQYGDIVGWANLISFFIMAGLFFLSPIKQKAEKQYKTNEQFDQVE